MANANLTAERLRELLNYSQETGDFTWKVVRRSAHGATKIGGTAGCKTKAGYIYIGIDGREYTAHRLAFLWMTGRWPSNHVDHIDRNPSCNEWKNLRQVTHKQNHENRCARKDSSTGILGVYLLPNGKFCAKIKHNRKSYHLGCFVTKQQAEDARRKAANELFTHAPPLA